MADQVQTANDAPRNNAAQEQPRPPEPGARPEPPRSPESRRRFGFLALGILVVLAVAAFFLWRYLQTYESTDDAQVDGHVNAISARVSGYVQSVNVQDNQYVEKGAVLVQIDPRDYQVALDHPKAELADS